MKGGRFLLSVSVNIVRMWEAERLQRWEYSAYRSGLGRIPTATHTELMTARHPTGQIQLEMSAYLHQMVLSVNKI